MALIKQCVKCSGKGKKISWQARVTEERFSSRTISYFLVLNGCWFSRWWRGSCLKKTGNWEFRVMWRVVGALESGIKHIRGDVFDTCMVE